MKKKFASLSLLILSFAANAQIMGTTSEENIVDPNPYDKWSIELNGGVNKPLRAMTPGYSTATLNPFHADLGVRYMFNPKFGLKLDFGYDKFQERDDTAPFESRMIRTSLQGVINLGRTLNFETWTNTIGLLAHGGFGVSQLSAKDNGFDGEDYMGHGILGLTGQIRLSNSVALTGDLSGLVYGRQNYNFDGMGAASTGALDGVTLNASVGLTFYLGKNEKHADWYSKDKYDELDERVTLIETGLIDSDKDGVADLYDLEPNTVAGVAVNTKGQAIDKNQNGVPDELESYLDSRFAQNNNTSATNSTVEELINGGYVNVYFDFNSSKPTNTSLSGVDFLVKYLKNNPSKSADVIGYADEIGGSGYNQTLSQKRAEAVKNVLINAGIDASRLTVSGNGEDASVNKNSKEARQIVRRVTFKVK
ncbi:OmpA family protein [Flavobacterium sp. ST-87]|uniref:OmpA family protein n=1 Tax=Flavobacterium plantiphilum TaxID=3163297 RepID=A0ABW8XPF2_9FLAO